MRNLPDFEHSAACEPEHNNNGSAQHEILTTLPPPPWLLNQTLLDNVWEIRTGDTNKIRTAILRLNFDVTIDPSASLVDPHYSDDLLAAKLFLYYAMSPSYRRYSKSSSIKVLMRNYMTFLRWRNSINLHRMSDLRTSHFCALFDSLESDGIRGLLPLDHRLALYAEGIEAGASIPFRQRGRRKIASIAKICIALGIPDSSNLTSRARERLLEICSSNGIDTISSSKAKRSNQDAALGPNRLAAFLQIPEMLWEMRLHLSCDPLSVNPFPDGLSPTKLASALSKTTPSRTYTAPSYQVCYLVNAALTWILKYADDVLELGTLYEANFTSHSSGDTFGQHRKSLLAAMNGFSAKNDGPFSPWPLYPSYPRGRIRSENPTLREAMFSFLPTAAVIVIAAFSARRAQEILSLRSGCVTTIDDDDWLESFIEKTVQDTEIIPVPRSVKIAVSVLERLSLQRRIRTSQDWIIGFDELAGTSKAPPNPIGGFNLHLRLADFAELIKTPRLEDGSVWKPAPHQFRRFFGIVYYNRYRYPHLTALSEFYKHFDLDVTRRYITEVQFGSFIRDQDEKRAAAKRDAARSSQAVQEERYQDFLSAALFYRIERFCNALSGKEAMSGFGGEAILALLRKAVDKFSAELDRDAPEEECYYAAAYRVAEQTRLEVNSLGHSACKCTSLSTDLAAAECLKTRAKVQGDLLSSAPDPTFAYDTVCGVCPHNVQFPEYQAYWDSQIASTQELLGTDVQGLLRTKLSVRLANLVSIRCRCFGVFESGT